LQYHQQACSGFDEFREAVKGWTVDFRQLEPGVLKSDIFQTQIGPIFFTDVRFSLRLDQCGAPPPGCWSFGFLGAASSSLVWRGREVPESSVVLYGPQTPIDAVSLPGFKARILSVSEEKISKLFGLVELPDPGDLYEGGEILRCDRQAVEDLFSFLNNTRKTCLTRASGGPQLSNEDSLLELLGHLGAVMRSHVRASTPRYRVRDKAVRKAREFVEDRRWDRVTVGDLCRISGVSIRTLEYGFRELFGITPETYLKIRRLNNVHNELIRSEPGNIRVTDVANRWDFWHMGDFAADYRKLFGELPSETLRRVR